MKRGDSGLKPIERKFREILDLIKTKKLKKASTSLKEMQQMRFPNGCPRFVECLQALLAHANGDKENAVKYGRLAEAGRPHYIEISTEIAKMYETIVAFEDLDTLLSSILQHGEYNYDGLLTLIGFKSINCKIHEASKLALTLIKNQPSDLSYGTAALLNYYMAKKENNPSFYKFVLPFISKIERKTESVIQLHARSLIALHKETEAIQMMHDPQTYEVFASNDIVLRRMIMDAYTSLGEFSKVGELAACFLREVNADSLDEWRLVVKYHQSPELVINELMNDILRGPRLAQIDLAKQKGENITPLLLAYSSKYSDKNCVFGDLKPYLEPSLFSSLSKISDNATRAFITGEIDFDIIDGRMGAIFVQKQIQNYLRTGEKSFLKIAMEKCFQFQDSRDCDVLNVMLCGIMGYPFHLINRWDHIRFESVQYFSESCLSIPALFKSFDLVALSNFYECVDTFYMKSMRFFHPSLIGSLKNGEFISSESELNFTYQARHHISRLFYVSFSVWKSLLESSPSQVNQEELYYLSGKELFIKNDTTILPVYFNDEKLFNAMYPSITNICYLYSAVVRILLSLHKNSTSDIQSLCEVITTNDSEQTWKPFVNFVTNNCECLPEHCNNIFEITSMIIASKLVHKKVPEELVQSFEQSASSLINSFQEFKDIEFINCHIEEQMKNIEKSLGLVRSFYK